QPSRPGTPPVHSWEAWGAQPDPGLLDGSGGVGHSAAATAAWLYAANSRPDLADARASARRFLEQAAAATGTGIPGVVPGVWPISRFEQVFGLYILLTADLLEHSGLRDVVHAQIDDLAQAMRPAGIGFSDFFVPDGDDTAAALAVLQTAGHKVDLHSLQRFAEGDHFCAFPGELQPSVSVQAHAVHALESGESQPTHVYITERQGIDGRWPGDKWHSSWLYTTSQAMIALEGRRHLYPIQQAVEALANHQHADGGWGVRGSTTEETAYGVLMLRLLQRRGILAEQAGRTLSRAEQWMLQHYRPFAHSDVKLWLDKDVYRPERIARVIELAATLPANASQEAE
ncbi:MAG TPA: prenyltransferase/squalene oxidase repeat-containing protein, partial [Roseiflexaceae bacterium]|nr:prenyltransferase/squalene oxidase repeat-containing protein [Roseiflexaceae bacterium]